jgi:hypothetical protein
MSQPRSAPKRGNAQGKYHGFAYQPQHSKILAAETRNQFAQHERMQHTPLDHQAF